MARGLPASVHPIDSGFAPNGEFINRLFLRPDMVAEPLIDLWHAWLHLIQPATAARNLTQRHLPINGILRQ